MPHMSAQVGVNSSVSAVPQFSGIRQVLPTLRHFIIRQEVIHLYRHAVRAPKSALPSSCFV